jgi:molybdate transport system substrate-binding protein
VTAAPAPVTVLAAASLTEAFDAAPVPGLHVTYDFAGSNTLATQIRQGAPADVFASADTRNMDGLVSTGLVDPPVVFARNRLEIAVARGNPRHVAGLQDLTRPGVSVVLAAPGVPAGDYTRAVESRLGISIHPVSLAPDVKSAITDVVDGEADATVVYVTDVDAAGAKVTGVPIAGDLQPAITYPITVVKASRHRAAAEAFVRAAVSGAVQRSLEVHGFLPAR